MADEPRCMHAILDGPGVRAKDSHGTLGRCVGFRGGICFFLMRWAINDHRAQTLRCAFPARLYRPLAPSSLSATLASGMLPWTCSSHRSRHTVCKFHSLDPKLELLNSFQTYCVQSTTTSASTRLRLPVRAQNRQGVYAPHQMRLR